MNFDNYYVQLSCGFNNLTFDNAPFDKLPNINTEGKELVLVLDPSSKQTGIALGTMDRELLYFADLKNLACSLYEYKTFINDFIHRLSEKHNITRFVYEVPFSRSGDVASEVLSNLEMNFSQYSKVIDGLTKDKMFPILPGVWRKGFLRDKRYDGRRKLRELLKEAAREQCGILYPQYKDYFFSTLYVPDSTDAIGIFNGFLDEYWYDEEKGIRKVSKINSRYSRNHHYQGDIVKGTLEEIIHIAKNSENGRDLSIYAYNKDYQFEENCEVVTSTTNDVCLLLALDRLSSDLLKWNLDQDKGKDELLAVVTYRKRKIK